MKRRLVALLCVAAMVAAMFGGCGNETGQETPDEPGTENEDEPDDQTPDDTADEGELEFVELNWFIGSNAKDVDLIQAALDEYFLEKLNCKVTLNVIGGGEYQDVISTKLMSGDEDVDLCTLISQVPYGSYAAMGALYPIDTLWDEYGTDVKGLFSEGVWDSLLVNDHVYAVPTLKDNAYIIGYIYNATLAEELGLDMENLDWSTYMDIEDVMMEALKLRDEKFPEYQGTPLMGGNPGDFPYFTPLERFTNNGSLVVCNIPGKEVVPEMGTDTVFNFYETDEFREMCLLKQRLIESGVMAYDYATFETDPKLMPSTLLNTAWGYTWIDENLFFGDGSTSKLVVFDEPWTDSNNYTTAMTAIGANSKNPERAMMVVELLNSDPYVATLMRFGVEGEHWEYDENGKMQLCNRNADPASPGWLEWYGVAYGNLTIVNGPESYVGPDGIMLEKMAEYNNEAILAAHMGFVLDTESITNELSACANVISEYDYLIKGQVESQEAVNQAVDEFIAKLRENGSEKIVTETQAQIDAWVANK